MATLPLRRRTVLRSAALAAAGTGGCSVFESERPTSPEGDETDSPRSETTGTGPTAADESTTSGDRARSGTATAATELDLREANVTAVEVESADRAAHRFSVTLYHDDDGEDGYADWWQVESLDGDRFGRRELLHPHSTAPFTRSETVEIPDGVDCVVVRGHDQTHEYGGRAMLVNPETGATRAVEQGSSRRSVDERSCP